MNPGYLAMVRGTRELHQFLAAGLDDSPEADAIRDATDGPWEALSEVERNRVRNLSEDLYSLVEPPLTPEPMNPQAQAKLNEAYEAKQRGEWDRALDLLRRWRAHIDPALLSYLRGTIWLEAGDAGTAALFFEQAAKLQPDDSSLTPHCWLRLVARPPLPQDFDATLPYFAYGLFQAGELCHRRVEPFLSQAPADDRVGGKLLIRDGLPLLVLDDANGSIDGSVLHFRTETCREAYEQILAFEPTAHYRWSTTTTLDDNRLVNTLVAKSPSKGHPQDFEGSRWSHCQDPVFGEGLQIVSDMIRDFGEKAFESSPPHDFEWPRFFKVQMAYLLLWAAIERYTTFAFGPTLDPMDRVKKLGELNSFQAAIEKHVSRTDVVTDSRNLDAYRLDPKTPSKAAQYYYQIRNNLSHRGKGAWNDGELVRIALRELLVVFRDVLAA